MAMRLEGQTLGIWHQYTNTGSVQFMLRNNNMISIRYVWNISWWAWFKLHGICADTGSIAEHSTVHTDDELNLRITKVWYSR